MKLPVPLGDCKHPYLAERWAQVRLQEFHAMLRNVIIIQKTVGNHWPPGRLVQPSYMVETSLWRWSGGQVERGQDVSLWRQLGGYGRCLSGGWDVHIRRLATRWERRT